MLKIVDFLIIYYPGLFCKAGALPQNKNLTHIGGIGGLYEVYDGGNNRYDFPKTVTPRLVPIRLQPARI